MLNATHFNLVLPIGFNKPIEGQCDSDGINLINELKMMFYRINEIEMVNATIEQALNGVVDFIESNINKNNRKDNINSNNSTISKSALETFNEDKSDEKLVKFSS